MAAHPNLQNVLLSKHLKFQKSVTIFQHQHMQTMCSQFVAIDNICKYVSYI